MHENYTMVISPYVVSNLIRQHRQTSISFISPKDWVTSDKTIIQDWQIDLTDSAPGCADALIAQIRFGSVHMGLIDSTATMYTFAELNNGINNENCSN